MKNGEQGVCFMFGEYLSMDFIERIHIRMLET